MTHKKINLTKGVWLVLLCCGILLFCVTNSQALLLNNSEVRWNGPIANVAFGGGSPHNYYTDYEFRATELGPDWLEAFCVEDADARGIEDYELIDVLPNYIGAAQIASVFFSGNPYGWSKTLTQIAIWDVALAGNFVYNSGLSPTEEGELNNILTVYDFSSSSTESIGYLRSPPGSAAGFTRQDYLISVPDARIMWLLGPAFIMLGLFGRKKSQEYL